MCGGGSGEPAGKSIAHGGHRLCKGQEAGKQVPGQCGWSGGSKGGVEQARDRAGPWGPPRRLWLSPPGRWEPQEGLGATCTGPGLCLRLSQDPPAHMLEETVGGTGRSRELSEEGTAVVTGGDGSQARVVALEGGTDLEGRANSTG